MGTTVNYAFPYPELTDPPDGPAQIKSLATAVDTALKNGVASIQAGQQQLVLTGVIGLAQTITFPRAYGTGIAPYVFGNIISASSTMNTFTIRCFSVSNTSFTGLLQSVTGTSVTYSPYVGWLAVVQAVSPLTRSAEPLALEPGWHWTTVTCHTPGCAKDGEPVPNVAVPDDPAEWLWSGVYCGVCGQPITDIVPM